MFHSQKQDWMGCAIATAATIGGITYEEAESLGGGRTPAQLRFPGETKRLLEKITHARWRWRRIWKPCRLRDFTNMAGGAIFG